ncbi:hypothetical protein GCM10009430_20320 [Aquimarina litoralis]|uniref:Nuclear transport factor 2 family protein n=1 Tax=Aquimarina litoralis TaxID=584605 RepID=A0ABN1IS90_9FLAO
MTKEELTKKYLEYLENGEIDKVIQLFTKDGVVVSPVYGTMLAKEFYYKLAEDTKSSKLYFDGLFVEENSNRISILFDYHWTLKNSKIVKFKVVDILELTLDNQIEKLTIIYDTVNARKVL